MADATRSRVRPWFLLGLAAMVPALAGCVAIPGGPRDDAPEFVRFESVEKTWDEAGDLWIDVQLRNTGHWTWGLDGPGPTVAWHVYALDHNGSLLELESDVVVPQPYMEGPPEATWYGDTTRARRGLPPMASEQGPFLIRPGDDMAFSIRYALTNESGTVSFLRYELDVDMWARPAGDDRPTSLGGRVYRSGCFEPGGTAEWFLGEDPPGNRPWCSVRHPSEDHDARRAQVDDD